jgi:2'-5' RNA ligase
MRNHWWWRPGWSVGRRFYTWHFTFEDHHELHQLVADYQQRLSDLPGLDLIPREWLHLTIQGVGFADEVSDSDLERITAATARHLRGLDPPQLTFQRAVVLPEAVALPPSPDKPVSKVRTAIRSGIADIWGDDHVPENNTFRPHVSVAYNNQDRPADDIVHAVNDLAPAPVTITLRSVDLIVLGRDEHVYRWRQVHRVPLGTR